jgi:hypothetical protein
MDSQIIPPEVNGALSNICSMRSQREEKEQDGSIEPSLFWSSGAGIGLCAPHVSFSVPALKIFFCQAVMEGRFFQFTKSATKVIFQISLITC